MQGIFQELGPEEQKSIILKQHFSEQFLLNTFQWLHLQILWNFIFKIKLKSKLLCALIWKTTSCWLFWNKKILLIRLTPIFVSLRNRPIDCKSIDCFRCGVAICLKGYLCCKTIFCHKVALDVQSMNFFIWNENNASFSRYLDFYVFVKSTDFKICDVIIKALLHNGSYTSAYFFWILSPITMKFGQALVCCMTNTSNMFLA